ncbi:GTP cyclohydrolase II [Glycomyces rhizosphaerae]|uniref:GTP cyclohydrolase II n=1 Tax=Glycomyces rhizosphaerae TaxID=2054422 RepID=A0ABV7Q565_9ACTN
MDVIQSLLKTSLGTFEVFCFDDGRLQPPIAFAFGEFRERPPLVRVQSECMPGLVFGSLTCDCAGQRDDSLNAITSDGAGVVIHLWQEGRGIGLADKMRAYARQLNDGADTVDANLLIGREIDEREYTDVATILTWLGVSPIRLLTNNPSKVDELGALGINIEEVVPIPPRVNPLNRNYIRTKALRLGHTYDLSVLGSDDD